MFGLELERMQRLISIIASAIAGALLTLPLIVAAKETVVVIHHPTIVAFFPVTQANLKNDPDTNEALADFIVYAGKMRKPLRDAGVDFQEIYAPSFRVQQGTRITTFRPGKVKVGYYLIAPGKRPRVEYGVVTDTDLLQIAKEYFALTAPPTAATSAYCSQVEHIRPNLELPEDTTVRGHIADQTGEPFRYSPIELRQFVSESEQITVNKVSTNGDGTFDLGVVKRGDYRLLLSPHRGFKQPAKLECWQKDCTLDTVLIVNPTDEPGAGCPVR
jgi:hypothetical protein